MKVKAYPFETATLRKGDRVARSQIESAYGVRAGTDAYRLQGLLRARDHLIQAFAERGQIVTVVEDHHDLVVLTDHEASLYNENRFDLSIRSAARCHLRMLGADRSGIDASRLAGHDRALEAQGRQLQAVRRERALAPAQRERATPSKLGGGR